MRLNPYERGVIRLATKELAGPAARVLLFGSRTRNELRGGDIDLLIELAQPSTDRLSIGLSVGARIERQLGPQVANVTVPGLLGWPTLGSSGMFALRHFALTAGSPWMPTCAIKPFMTRKMALPSKYPILTRL